MAIFPFGWGTAFDPLNASRAPRQGADDPVRREPPSPLPAMSSRLGDRPEIPVDPRRAALVQVAVRPQDRLPRPDLIAGRHARARDAVVVHIGPPVPGDVVRARRAR